MFTDKFSKIPHYYNLLSTFILYPNPLTVISDFGFEGVISIFFSYASNMSKERISISKWIVAPYSFTKRASIVTIWLAFRTSASKISCSFAVRGKILSSHITCALAKSILQSCNSIRGLSSL